MLQITAIGRLTKDPEIKQNKNGKEFVVFDLAVNRGHGDKQYNQQPQQPYGQQQNNQRSQYGQQQYSQQTTSSNVSPNYGEYTMGSDEDLPF